MVVEEERVDAAIGIEDPATLEEVTVRDWDQGQCLFNNYFYIM